MYIFYAYINILITKIISVKIKIISYIQMFISSATRDKYSFISDKGNAHIDTRFQNHTGCTIYLWISTIQWLHMQYMDFRSILVYISRFQVSIGLYHIFILDFKLYIVSHLIHISALDFTSIVVTQRYCGFQTNDGYTTLYWISSV